MTQLVPDVNECDHTQGNPNARITVVTYGDYQCPYCGRFHPVVKRLQRTLGGRMKFVYRHFPLTQIHDHSMDAAEVAEAAGAQGSFWKMHDVLFENQHALDPGHLHLHARRIGLDMNRFEVDLHEHRFAPLIRAHFKSGLRSGVSGTPAIFIDGARYDGPRDYESLLLTLTGSERQWPQQQFW